MAHRTRGGAPFWTICFAEFEHVSKVPNSVEQASLRGSLSYSVASHMPPAGRPRTVDPLYEFVDPVTGRKFVLVPSGNGKRMYVEDHEPGFVRIRREVKLHFTRADILNEVTIPDAIADAMADKLQQFGALGSFI